MAPKRIVASEAIGNTAIEGANPPMLVTRSTTMDQTAPHQVTLVLVNLALAKRQSRLKAAIGDLQGNVDGIAAT